jgi:SpoVK/Ycf46/Vps4 family AAA+-type ATPase
MEPVQSNFQQSNLIHTIGASLRTGNVLVDILIGTVVATCMSLVMSNAALVWERFEKWWRGRIRDATAVYKYKFTIRLNELQVSGADGHHNKMAVNDANGILITGIIRDLVATGAIDQVHDQEVKNLLSDDHERCTRDRHLESVISNFPQSCLTWKGMQFEFENSCTVNTGDKEPSVSRSEQIVIQSNDRTATLAYFERCKADEIARIYPAPVQGEFKPYYWFIANKPGKEESYVFNRYPWSSAKTFDSLFFSRKTEMVQTLDHFRDCTGPWAPEKQRTHTCNIFLWGNPGGGKCLAVGTKLLTHDGAMVRVEDVKVGDLLMGDSGEPRRVQNTCRGLDTMYRITQGCGGNYVVNSVHVLSLKLSIEFIESWSNEKGKNHYKLQWYEAFEMKQKSFTVQDPEKTRKHKTNFTTKETAYQALEEFKAELNQTGRANRRGDICDIPLDQYLKKSTAWRHAFKGFKRAAVDWWPEQRQQLPAYMMGYWLGDGTSSGAAITSQDSTVIQYFAFAVLDLGNVWLQHSDRYTYRITSGRGAVNGAGTNPFMNALRRYDVLNNKHVSSEYKYGSVEQRRELLAGFLDADGHLKATNCFEYTQKSRRVFDDIMYVARSLGLMVTENKTKVVKGVEYYRAIISGEGIEMIPTKCPRKQARAYGHNKDPLVSEIWVERLEQGEYAGFELDGNGRFCLADFTVTHNTSMVKAIANYMGRHIFGINMQRVRCDEDMLDIVSNILVEYRTKRYNSFDSVPLDKRIYLLEDLDCAGCEHIIAPRDPSASPAAPLRVATPKEENDDDTPELTTRGGRGGVGVIQFIAAPVTPTPIQGAVTNDQMSIKFDVNETSLSGFLNMLNGINELTGAMFIISTNHKEKFDPAIYRPGRMDVDIEMGCMNSADIMGYLARYYNEEATTDVRDLVERAKCSIMPSRVEQICQAHSTLTSAAEAIAAE